MIARSLGVPSSFTRMVSYIVFVSVDPCKNWVRQRRGSPSSASDDLPRRLQRVREPVDIHGGDQNSTGPTCDQQNPAIFPVPHSFSGAGELQQGKHGERKLQRQHHLTERQQVGHTA